MNKDSSFYYFKIKIVVGAIPTTFLSNSLVMVYSSEAETMCLVYRGFLIMKKAAKDIFT
jgi:hypothetical protein